MNIVTSVADKCPYCGYHSTEADKCPHCGYQTQNAAQAKKDAKAMSNFETAIVWGCGFFAASSVVAGLDVLADGLYAAISPICLGLVGFAGYFGWQYWRKQKNKPKSRYRCLGFAVVATMCGIFIVLPIQESITPPEIIVQREAERKEEKAQKKAAAEIAERSEKKAEKAKTRESDVAWKCRELILANVKHPSLADIHYIFGKSVRTAKTTGNVVVTITFDAKNDFGAMLPHKARCVFPPGKSGEIQISNR